jgi:hypothetical protein
MNFIKTLLLSTSLLGFSVQFVNAQSLTLKKSARDNTQRLHSERDTFNKKCGATVEVKANTDKVHEINPQKDTHDMVGMINMATSSCISIVSRMGELCVNDEIYKTAFAEIKTIECEYVKEDLKPNLFTIEWLSDVHVKFKHNQYNVSAMYLDKAF